MEAVPEKSDTAVDGNSHVDDVPEYEKQNVVLSSTIADIIALVESFSKRLFTSASNYKQKMELDSDAPGKKEFRQFNSQVRKLLKHTTKLYKQQKPKAKKDTSSSKHTGFNRIVHASAKMTKFMLLGDWALLSEVNPELGVVTHGLITRYISNYVITNSLHNKEKTSTWVADPALLELFKDEWVKEGVDPKNVKYTDVQKLIKHHMSSVPDKARDDRHESEYRKKLDDDGEFGGATKKILEHRKELDTLAILITKRNKVLVNCRDKRLNQGITKEYEELLKADITKHGVLAKEIKTKCENYGFSIAASYPTTPSTCLTA